MTTTTKTTTGISDAQLLKVIREIVADHAACEPSIDCCLYDELVEVLRKRDEEENVEVD